MAIKIDSRTPAAAPVPEAAPVRPAPPKTVKDEREDGVGPAGRVAVSKKAQVLEARGRTAYVERPSAAERTEDRYRELGEASRPGAKKKAAPGPKPAAVPQNDERSEPSSRGAATGARRPEDDRKVEARTRDTEAAQRRAAERRATTAPFEG